jgi:hypothetical protein
MEQQTYPEIIPAGKPFKKIYLSLLLFITGRAIAAAYRHDKEVKRNLDLIGEKFLIRLGVINSGPAMFIGKKGKEPVKYLGSKYKNEKPLIDIKIKNIEAAMLMFTFRESSAAATYRNRVILDGDMSAVCAFMRAFDIVEIYLLPKLIARLAIKRYPKWTQMNPVKKHIRRILIYISTFTGL